MTKLPSWLEGALPLGIFVKGGAPGPSTARLGGAEGGSCADGAGVCASATETEQAASSITSFRIIPPERFEAGDSIARIREAAILGHRLPVSRPRHLP